MNASPLLECLVAGMIAGYIAAFILSLVVKWRIDEWYNTRRPATWPMFCYFCAGFWLCIAITTGYISYMGFNLYYPLIAVIGTMVSIKGISHLL